MRRVEKTDDPQLRDQFKALKKQIGFSVYDIAKITGMRGWKIYAFWMGRYIPNEDEKIKIQQAIGFGFRAAK